MAVTSPLIRRPSATTRRLFVLAGGTFVFVTTETQPIALLTPMAHGLGVSESSVGLLMTAYAAVAALTAIPLTIFASRIPRRGLVIATVSILVVSQIGLALAPSYAMALGARLLGAVAHGVFWSVIAQVAATLVSRDRIGRATAIVFAGNSAALVAGTPLVSALGALLGWRAAVGCMGVIAALVGDPAADAAIAAAPVTDTIKESADGKIIARTPDRSKLWAVQTPQSFRLEIIRRALSEVRRKGLLVTDDTAACELIGQPVRLIASTAPNPKVTRPEDLPYLDMLLRKITPE